MAELNLDYYTAKDHYSDGDIEETLLKMAQEGKSFEDLPEEEVSFPMVYHFSGLRENILSWYPLKKAGFRSGDRSRMRSHYRNALPQGRSCDFRGAFQTSGRYQLCEKQG